MKNGTVIYASRYGSTQEYARAIADGLEFSALNVSEVGSEHFNGSGSILPVVLGSPIYGYSVLPEMVRFLERFGSQIQGRVAGAFVVCGDTLWIPEAGEGGNANLDKLTSLLSEPVPAVAVFGGRMVMSDLNDEDRQKILTFYEKIGKEPVGFDRMDLDAIEPFVDMIKEQLAKDP